MRRALTNGHGPGGCDDGARRHVSSISPSPSGPRGARRRGRRCRARPMQPGSRPRTGRTRSSCSRSRRRRGCPSWCRSATAACSSRRSRSTAARAYLMAVDLAGDAAHRPARAALRRRAPVELRRLRRARPAARVQHQRLRRDAARPVRVGRQAAGRELRRRRPRPRLRRQAARRRSTATVVRVLPRGDPASSPRCGTSTLWYARVDVDDGRRRSSAAQATREAAEALRAERRQGPHEGQPEGVRQADRRSSTASRGSSATRR